ncbi:MAG: hypothetical protein HQ446_08890 [Polaromonas sp.]|nr:hypothetical protein [Polaromonas sp.]
MGIASFLPVFGRTTGLSMLLAPVQALAALFVPAQSASARPRTVISPHMAYRASVQSRTTFKPAVRSKSKIVPVTPVQRLKIVRQFEPGARHSCTGRLAISGRMSDVCAELERMAG